MRYPYHLGLGTNDRFCMTPRLSGPILSTRLDGCPPLSVAIEVLRSNIASKVRLKQSKPILERLEIEIEPTDLLRWLAAQTSGQRSFFRNREGTLTSAGIGCAVDFPSWEDPALRELLKPVSDQSKQKDGPSEPIFYCASFFDPAAIGKHAPEWAGFARMNLVLPLVEIRRTNQTILAVHIIGDGSAVLAALEQCESSMEHLPLPRGLRIAADGDPVRWADGIDAALGAIASGSIDIGWGDQAGEIEKEAWTGKAKMAFGQLNLLSGANSEVGKRIQGYENLYGLTANKKLPPKVLVGLVVAISFILLGTIIFRSFDNINKTETLRIQNSISKTQQLFLEKKYDAALMESSNITWR